MNGRLYGMGCEAHSTECEERHGHHDSRGERNAQSEALTGGRGRYDLRHQVVDERLARFLSQRAQPILEACLPLSSPELPHGVSQRRWSVFYPSYRGSTSFPYTASWQSV